MQEFSRPEKGRGIFSLEPILRGPSEFFPIVCLLFRFLFPFQFYTRWWSCVDGHEDGMKQVTSK